ncbi:hypothetical protein XENOCAPTIV_000373 [Xenoophorus captivus]|uniref:Uncharacterized protein n=1 Tax=Xenoophorus captivus TaxID=1517983 RepID=A0ABV0QM54_9TELE
MFHFIEHYAMANSCPDNCFSTLAVDLWNFSRGELMRMTRPMGEEDRIPRRRCSFFRKRLRVAVCELCVAWPLSLRDGSDEKAMGADCVSFHTHSTKQSAPGGGL